MILILIAITHAYAFVDGLYSLKNVLIDDVVDRYLPTCCLSFWISWNLMRRYRGVMLGGPWSMLFEQSL